MNPKSSQAFLHNRNHQFTKLSILNDAASKHEEYAIIPHAALIPPNKSIIATTGPIMNIIFDSGVHLQRLVEKLVPELL